MIDLIPFTFNSLENTSTELTIRVDTIELDQPGYVQYYDDSKKYLDYNLRHYRIFHENPKEPPLAEAYFHFLKFHRHPILKLEWFGIHHDFRGKGLGTEFLKFVLNDIEENWDCYETGVTICDVSHGSGIYTRCGFSESKSKIRRYTFPKYRFRSTRRCVLM